MDEFLGAMSDPALAITPAETENALGQPISGHLPSGSPVEAIEAALGVIPPRPMLPLPWWLAPLAICSVIGIIPWIVYLAITLPGHERAVDYDIAWVGFDCAMCLVLAALGYCALRRKPATGPIAAVASTMLIIDAWFDIVTTDKGNQLALAIFLAVIAEIPLAIICAWVAVNAERVRARAYRGLRQRWERAVQIARTALPQFESAQTVTEPRDQQATR